MKAAWFGGLAVLFAAAVAIWPRSARADSTPQSATRTTEREHGNTKPGMLDQAYLEHLIVEARARRLHERTTWLRLLHYRRTLFGGYRSEADAKEFFLSEHGKTDPALELEATLRGLFGSAQKNPKLEHPFCQFPARLAWLNAELDFDFARLPRRSCPRFQQFYARLDPKSVTLVFSSYYLNNPASAFGHTFLRVNKRRRKADDQSLALLDYGIDYSAAVDTGNALVYAIKGMTGMFPGVFRRVPYYLKVREYNDYESRDLWEYELNLTDGEVSQVIAHLWELGSNYFDYFYLSENCSYHILAALDVANPEFELLDHVGWPVIPADTVRAVYAQPGLIRTVHYRPSNRTQFRLRLQGLSGAEAGAVAQLLKNPDATLQRFSEGERVRALDAALDWVDFRYARDLTRPSEEQDAHGALLKQRLLERRAAIETDSEDLVVAPPFRKMPHMGHESSRIGLGSGFDSERGWFHALDFRLALHDLADPLAGYPETYGIEFLPMRFRYYIERPAFSVEDISLIRVTNLSPLDGFDKTWSWTLRAGATKLRDAGCANCFAGIGEFGAGVAFHAFAENLLFFGLGEARLLFPVTGGLGDLLRAGIGPGGGVRLKFTDDLLALGSLHWQYLPAQEPTSTWTADGTLRWQYTKDFALSVEYERQPAAYSLRCASLIYF